MKPLCQTCTNIFNFPECCTEKLGESVGIMTHCGNYSGIIMQGETEKEKRLEERFHIPEEIKESWSKRTEIDFNIIREMAPNGEYAYSIQQNILAMVINEEERIVSSAIYEWAKAKGYDEVLLIDEEKLKTILKLGAAEYERLHGGMK